MSDEQRLTILGVTVVRSDRAGLWDYAIHYSDGSSEVHRSVSLTPEQRSALSTFAPNTSLE